MNRIKKYIDISFCLVFLPLMIIIFPVERWFHNFPTYTISVGVWLYAVYAINRIVTVPLLFSRYNRILWGCAILLLSIIATYQIAGIKLYEPKPSIYDAGITRHLPIVEQYQQCIWSLFVIVEFFSMAFGSILEYATARNHWLLKIVEEEQARELLMEENKRIKAELANTSKNENSGTITLKSGYKNIPIVIDEILFVEAMENYVRVVRKEKSTIVAQISMKAMEEMLASHGFMRVHRSYIVSTKHIESYNRKEIRIASHSDLIPVGRKYAASVAELKQ